MSVDTHPGPATLPDPRSFRWPLRRWRDPRLYQIIVLSSLILYGTFQLGFPLTLLSAAVIFGSALGTQYLAGRMVGLTRFDPMSPIITGCSLCLLSRSTELWGLALVAALAIASKFVLRVDGRHVFNPANVALVIPALLSSAFWISPGQWGSDALLAFAFAGGAMLVLFPAARWDVALSFLGATALIAVGLALYREDPLSIPLHQLQSGALLLFSFFMITDPATTPVSRLHRIIWALAVAALGAWLVHAEHIAAGPIIALVVLCPLVPLLNRLHRGQPVFSLSIGAKP
ncbi:MAG: hypothetical protein Alpg2KO_06160 [Alphaproteobacteria bacterium]